MSYTDKNGTWVKTPGIGEGYALTQPSQEHLNDITITHNKIKQIDAINNVRNKILDEMIDNYIGGK